MDTQETKQNQEITNRRPFWKRSLRFTGKFFLWSTVFVLLLFMLLNLYPVQTFLAQKAAAYFSKQLGVEVHIGTVQLTFINQAVINDFYIKDKKGNMLMSTKSARCKYKSLPIFNNKLIFNKITLSKPNINITQYLGDTTLNIQFLLDYFISKDTAKTPSKEIIVKCRTLSIDSGKFNFNNQNIINLPKGSFDKSNIQIKDFNVELSKFLFRKDTMSITVNKLQFKDRSGFELKNLSCCISQNKEMVQLSDFILETPNTNLNLRARLIPAEVNKWDDFINSVQLEADIFTSKIGMKDVGYFSPKMKSYKQNIEISGQIKGKIANLKLKDLRLKYGKSTFFEGSIATNGLPDIEGTFIRLTVKKFTTSKYDLESLKLPVGDNQKLVIPEQLLALGNIMIKGEFTGFYNDFNAYGELKSQIGNLYSDLRLAKQPGKKDLAYSGHLSTESFNLGKILNSEDVLGRISLNMDVSGLGTTLERAQMTLDGKIQSLEFKGNTYDSIRLGGELANNKFNGTFKIDDEKVFLEFLGVIDFSKKTKVFNFSADIKNADLYALNLASDKYKAKLSTHINSNFKAVNIDDMRGNIVAEGTTFVKEDISYNLHNLILNTQQDSTGSRLITLNSDYVDAEIKGSFSFNTIVPAFEGFIRKYLPSFSIKHKAVPSKIPDQNFNYDFYLKNTDILTELFLPNFSISPNSRFYGNYSSRKNDFSLKGDIEDLKIGIEHFQKWYIKSSTEDEKLIVQTGCKKLIVSDSIGFDNLRVLASMQKDSILYNLYWKDNLQTTNSSGNVWGYLVFRSSSRLDMKVIQSDFLIENQRWALNSDNLLTLDKSYISLNQFEFANNDQKIFINGKISKNPLDKLTCQFKNFDFNSFEFILSHANIDIDGVFNGNVDFYDLYNSPVFYSDLTVKKLAINKKILGDLILKSNWDKEKQAIFSKMIIEYTGNIGTSTPLKLEGYYYSNRKTDNLDYKVELKNLRLDFIQHWLKNFSSKFEGKASGLATIKGSLDKPDINGRLLMQKTEFKIDFLNTVYSLADSFDISSNSFSFKNFTFTDEAGNTAHLNGSITHKAFSNIKIDLTVNAKKFMMLNSTAVNNDIFYGKAFTSGIVKVKGPIEDIYIDANLKTEKGSYLTLPITDRIDVRQSNYISFINPNKQILHEKKLRNLLGIRLKFDLNITPDADFEIQFPSNQMGGIIQTSGSSNMKMLIDSDGEFLMYGDYMINDGVYLLSLQNLPSKKFNIQNGGIFSFTGNPYDARVDMKAIYNLRTSLYPVLAAVGSIDEVSRKKVPVQSVIGIKGKLQNPEISFDINLPNVDQEVRDAFFSIVDKQNEQEMIKQTFSLLVMNSFVSARPDEPTNSLGAGVGASSFEIISNQITNWLSQISRDFDIGVNYRPGDQMTTQQLQVALSTQLFNDRVTIDGNLGVGGNIKNTSGTGTGTTSPAQASNIVGDVNVEVKLTEDGRWRLKAFNRSNETDYLKNNSPYTQGVGLFYRKEFDSFHELFHRQKKTDELGN